METIEWLLDNPDPSLEHQVKRDLLDESEDACGETRKKIEKYGHGKLLLDRRNSDGSWGNGAYNPKWTCTHYVISELMQLGIDQDNEKCKESAESLLENKEGNDGGINYARTVEYSDVCINGMLLSMGSYFKLQPGRLKVIIDFLLKARMDDGGWNCEYIHGAKKSSLHTTIAVLEGINAYVNNNYEYKKSEFSSAKASGIEFILKHRLFKSKTTGEIIKDDFLKFAFPVRWKYDVLRCLDFFREAKIEYDERMEEGIEILERSMGKNGRCKGHSQPGREYYKIERDKWNTLRAMRVLKYFGRQTLGNDNNAQG